MNCLCDMHDCAPCVYQCEYKDAPQQQGGQSELVLHQLWKRMHGRRLEFTERRASYSLASRAEHLFVARVRGIC